MPTGYTAIIEEGEGCTFREYLLRCARAFGALIEMRDDPLTAEIPPAFTPSQHHAEWAARERKRIAELEAMTPEQAEAAARDEYERCLAEHERMAGKAKTLTERYAAMRAAAADWLPPTPDHYGLKRFMVEQIDLCAKGGFGPYGGPPTLQSGPEWRATHIANSRNMAERYEEGQREEEKRCAERNAWVDALRASIRDE